MWAWTACRAAPARAYRYGNRLRRLNDSSAAVVHDDQRASPNTPPPTSSGPL